MDEFHMMDIPVGRLVELYNRDPLKIFELVKPLVEEKAGRVGQVRLHDKFLDGETGSALLEYMVGVKNGEIGVKVIYSKDPGKALMKYYEHEK